MNRTTLTLLSLPLALLIAATSGSVLAQPIPSGISTTGVLGLDELERRVTADGISIREIEVRDLLLKVEGFDSQNRKVKLVLDRRSGEVLSREIKLPKQQRYGN